MVRAFWSRVCVLGFFCISLCLTSPVLATSYSELYIHISDAKTALQDNRQEEARQLLEAVQEGFTSDEMAKSKAGQAFQETLDSILEKKKLQQSDLVVITTKLIAFEEEQNPLDVEAEKQAFEKKVYPALDDLAAVVGTGDVAAMKDQYLTFNAIWTRNESIVRTTSTAHYGQIETAMSFLRSAMEIEPYDASSVQKSLDDLRAALDAFMAGEAVAQTTEVTTLAAGITLLDEALAAFQKKDSVTAQDKIKQFITNWPTFEGEVSTRSSSLYTRVETELPVIMVKGQESAYQNQLANLLDELKAIVSSGNYTALDAMLILLREGVEALLIVLALVGTLKASNQKKGLKWIYSGAVTGLGLSFVAAWLLQVLFPTVSSGTNREMLEGYVGIFAVIMMLGVGIWLHGKTSAKAWQAYMDKKLALAMSTGGFVSFFSLSFLAVFREGAETILFYVGILPRITAQDFWMGIGMAVVLLGLLALLFTKWSGRLPVGRLFSVMTVMIYALAFKMLGTSLHHLQLTGVLSNHVLPSFPVIDWLGIYPNLEVLGSQLVFLVVLVLIDRVQKRGETHV